MPELTEIALKYGVSLINNDGKKNRVGLDCLKNTKQIKELL